MAYGVVLTSLPTCRNVCALSLYYNFPVPLCCHIETPWQACNATESVVNVVTTGGWVLSTEAVTKEGLCLRLSMLGQSIV